MTKEAEHHPATLSVQREWARRIEAEYRSAAMTQQLTLWLIQLGAPRELIDDGLRIVADELDHADLSARVCVAAGSPTTPQLNQADLGLERRFPRLEEDVAAACVRFFCLGETVAVPLFKELRSACTEPTSRAALDRILRDEVRHRQFGWDLLEFLTEAFPHTRGRVQSLLPEFLKQMWATYGAISGGHAPLGVAERSWGLMPPQLYRSILEKTIRDEYVPRFRSVSIEVDPAWAHGSPA